MSGFNLGTNCYFKAKFDLRSGLRRFCSDCLRSPETKKVGEMACLLLTGTNLMAMLLIRGEPERAKMAAKPPIFASILKKVKT